MMAEVKTGSIDVKLQIFADLYARYRRENDIWYAQTAELEGPWQQAMDGLLGYAEITHGLTCRHIIRHAMDVEL